MKSPECLGTVTGGKFIPADPISWAFDSKKLEGHPCCVRRVFGKRTKLQGNAWWGVVVPIYMRCMGHLNKDFAHYELVTILEPITTIDIKGREHVGPTPTNDMDTAQSVALYHKAQDFIGSEYGVDVPDPDPRWKGFKS